MLLPKTVFHLKGYTTVVSEQFVDLWREKNLVYHTIIYFNEVDMRIYLLKKVNITFKGR